MKITKSQLKEIIREEIQKLNEGLTPTMTTVGGVVYVDSDFVQTSSKYGVLEPVGMGNFDLRLKGYPGGTVRYVRVNQKFDGFTGRAHKVLGDALSVKFILKNMKRWNKTKITKSQLKEIIREEIQKISSNKSLRLKPIIENWVLSEDGETIVNPETNRKIKVSTALSYPKDHPAYKAAVKSKGNSDTNDEPKSEPKSTNSDEKLPTSKEWFDKEQQPISKVREVMPDADPDTFGGGSDVDDLSPKQRRKVSTRIDRISDATKKAKEEGKPLPNINLCDVTVPGTNLYCDGNKGIPRDRMPQFKGNPEPGSPADKLPRDKSGEVDTEPLFREHLKKKGIKAVPTKVPSDQLKATQGELDGGKVSGMTQALRENPNNPAIRAPIYVTRDGYVVDGHHRWAAMTSYAAETGEPLEMDVIVIDTDAESAVDMGNEFMEEIGIKPKSADPNKQKKESKLSLKSLVNNVK